MKEERRRILDLLAEGKINAGEAERLLNALHGAARDEDADGEGPFFAGMRRMRRHVHRMHAAQGGERRYIRIVVDQEEGGGRKERIRIKVPVKLLKAGISLSGLLPRDVRERVQEALKEKGVDVDPFSLRGATADEIVHALADLEIDVGKTGQKIRIYAVDEDDDDERAEDDEGVVQERTVRRKFRSGDEPERA